MPGNSNAKVSTAISPMVSTVEKQGGSGIVKLGEVSSLATWKSVEDRIVITFNTKGFSADQLRDLEHYRTSSRPVEVKLPGEGQTMSCVVKGFERNATTASFYLTNAGKR